MRARILGAAFLLLSAATSCKHEVETFPSEALSDYLPLAPGKFITYQLDSFVYTGFGQNLERHRYQEKHLADGQFADNGGRPSFRMYRFLRDSTGSTPWVSAGTYFITPTENTIEVVENNLRTVRLALPLQDGYSWKGNSYWPDDAYEPTYEFSNDNLIDRWQFTYGVRGSETINGKTFPDVLPVYHIDETENSGGDYSVQVDTLEKGSRSFSMEKYAKGIGLVYQELVLWEHQTGRKEDRSKDPWVITFSPFYTGFGIRRTLLEHN